MPTIDIDTLRSTFDLRVFASFLLGKAQHHRNYDIYNCPRHSDRTPSLTIYDHSFYCFGCNHGGSVFDFLIYYKGLTFKEALAEISEQAPQYKLEAREVTPEPEVELSMSMVQDYASHIDKGLPYFESRGITDRTSYQIPLGVNLNYRSNYQLSDGTWFSVEAPRYVVPNIFDGRVRSINYRRNDGAFLEAFFNHPAHGRVMDDLSINYTGKAEDNILDVVSGAKYKQEPGSKWKPFNVGLIARREEGKIVYLPQPYLLVYAESKEFDVLAAMDKGYPIVGVTFTHALEPILPKLFEHIPMIYIVRDNDEAGMMKAIRLQNILKRGRILTPLERCKDVGDMIKEGSLIRWLDKYGLDPVLK